MNKKVVGQEALRTICEVDVNPRREVNTYKIIRMFDNIIENEDGSQYADVKCQVIDKFDMTWAEIEKEGGVGAVNEQIKEAYGVVKW